MPAAGDEYFLGQGKMQKADFLGGAAQAADEIGKHAVKTGVAPLQLLMLVGSYEKRPRRLGKLRRGRQELAGTHIGKVEMEARASRHLAPAASRHRAAPTIHPGGSDRQRPSPPRASPAPAWHRRER